MRAPGIFGASRTGKSTGSWLSGVYQRQEHPPTPRSKDGWLGGTEAEGLVFEGPYSAERRHESSFFGLPFGLEARSGHQDVEFADTAGKAEGVVVAVPASSPRPRGRATRQSSASYLIARSKSPRPAAPPLEAPPPPAPSTVFPGLLRSVSPQRGAPWACPPVAAVPTVQGKVPEAEGMPSVPRKVSTGYLFSPADLETKPAEFDTKPVSPTKEGQGPRSRVSRRSSTSYLFAPTDLEDAQRKGVRLDTEMRDLQREIDELAQAADPGRLSQKDELQRQMQELAEGLAVLKRYSEIWERDARLVRV